VGNASSLKPIAIFLEWFMKIYGRKNFACKCSCYICRKEERDDTNKKHERQKAKKEIKEQLEEMGMSIYCDKCGKDIKDGITHRCSRQVDVLLAALVTEWENFANRCDKEAQKGFNCCEITELSTRASELRDCAKEIRKILTKISS
jgi:hypothetical protein